MLDNSWLNLQNRWSTDTFTIGTPYDDNKVTGYVTKNNLISYIMILCRAKEQKNE